MFYKLLLHIILKNKLIMKTILSSVLMLGMFFLSSCEKQESTPISNELQNTSIKFKDTISDAGTQVTYDFKVDVDFNRETGEIVAKLISEMPKYGWDIGYSLFRGETPMSNHTYRKIKKNEVRFKVMAFPSVKDGKEYSIEITSNSTGSRTKDPKNSVFVKFKNN